MNVHHTRQKSGQSTRIQSLIDSSKAQLEITADSLIQRKQDVSDDEDFTQVFELIGKKLGYVNLEGNRHVEEQGNVRTFTLLHNDSFINSTNINNDGLVFGECE